MLYADPESARQNIMRLPSSSYTEAPPAQESPLAGRGNSSNHAVADDDQAVSIDSRSCPDANVSHRITDVKPTVADGDSSSSADGESLRSDPFDLRLSVDAGPQLNNIDEVIRLDPRVKYIVRTPESLEREYQFTLAAMENPVADYDEGADAQAYVPSSSRPSPFRFMSALTKCFLQERPPPGPRFNDRKHI